MADPTAATTTVQTDSLHCNMVPNECDSKTESTISKIENLETAKKENNPGDSVESPVQEVEVGKQGNEETSKAISTENQNQNAPTVVRLGDGNENTPQQGLLKTYYEEFDAFADDELSDVELAEFDLDELLSIEKEDSSLDTAMADIISKTPSRSQTPKGLHNSPGGESSASASLPKPSSEEVEGDDDDETFEINGVVVRLTMFCLTEGDQELFKHGRLGKYRCKCPSSLRRCWMPL